MNGGEFVADKNLEITPGMSPIIQQIKSIMDTARSNVARQVNNELLNAYWNIGRIICEYEQADSARADYGKQTLKALSKELTKEFGKGFSVSNIQFMRRFYQNYHRHPPWRTTRSWR